MLGKKSLRAASRALSNCISIFSHISSLVWWWHKTKITSAHEIYFLSCWEGFHFLVRKFRLTPFESLEALFATFEYTASILWRIRGNKEWGALMRWKHLTLTHSRCRGWLEFVNWYLVSRYKWLCFSTFPPCRRSTISTCTMCQHVWHFQAILKFGMQKKSLISPNKVIRVLDACTIFATLWAHLQPVCLLWGVCPTSCSPGYSNIETNNCQETAPTTTPPHRAASHPHSYD